VAKAREARAHHELGRAILNLERARLLSPESDSINQSLAQARAAANLPTSEPAVAGTAAQLSQSDQLGDLALLGLAVAGVALLAFVRKVAGRRAFLVIAILGSMVASAAVVAAIRTGGPPPNLAVVVSAEPVARIAPSAGAAPSFSPREGSMVFIERRKGPFVMISDGGRRGWAPRSSVEAVLPEK
jgi:hypothetical protein